MKTSSNKERANNRSDRFFNAIRNFWLISRYFLWQKYLSLSQWKPPTSINMTLFDFRTAIIKKKSRGIGTVLYTIFFIIHMQCFVLELCYSGKSYIQCAILHISRLTNGTSIGHISQNSLQNPWNVRKVSRLTKMTNSNS